MLGPSHWYILLAFTLIPAVIIILGSLFTFLKTPSVKVTSAIQHFAAGIVVAVVAVELIPMITRNEHQWVVALGFALGVIVMLWVGSSDEGEGESGTQQKFPMAMMIAIGTDLFIDGILVGVAYLANSRSGFIIALALTLETLFLGLSLSATMQRNAITATKRNLSILILAALIPAGGLLGYFVMSWTGPLIRAIVLAFGVAALLYLVTEGLLVEAHETPDTKPIVTSFFVGFLVILLIST